MEAEHIVTLTVGAMGLIGVLAGVFFGKRRGPRSPERRAREDLAADTVATPASPGTEGTSTALDLAQYAVTQARGVSIRLDEVEDRLTRLQRAYSALFGWARRIESEWEDIRTRDRPPPLPDDAHYTD